MVPSRGNGPGNVFLAFLLLGAPLAAGAFVSTGWSWGWDHLHRAGPVWSMALLFLAAAAWAPGVSGRLSAAADHAGGGLKRHPVLIPVLLSLLGVALFAALPIGTRLYGDSKVIVDDHTPGHLAVYIHRLLKAGLLGRGSACFAFHDLLARVTGLSFEKTFMLVSVLCGGLFVFFHARLAATVPAAAPWARIAILWIGLTDGANQLFFGHVETYIVPRFFECLFLIAVVRALLDPSRPTPWARPLLWFALAVFFHAQALVLLPTALLWIGWHLAESRPFLRRWVGGRAAVAGILLAVLGLAIAYLAFGSNCYDYIYTGGRPHPRQLFLPFTTSCTGLPYIHYTLFSGPHLLDLIGSLYSISSPAILLTTALLLPRAGKQVGLFLLLPSVATAFLHNFILNPAIGFPFDWDLMCVLSPPLLYTAVLLLARSASAPRGFLGALLILGIGTATLFGVNASTTRVYQRVEDMGIWLHRTYFGGSHFRLSANLSTIRDPRLQIAERERVLARLSSQAYPEDREVAFLWERLGVKKAEIEDYQGAKEAYRRAFDREPTQWLREKPLGYLESEVGNRGEGIRLLSDYLRRSPEDAEAWLFLGDAHAAEGAVETARKCWSRFLNLTPDSPDAPRVREDLLRLPGSPQGEHR